MFRSTFITQILAWCEKPGDHYARAWGLWLVLTMLSHEASEEKLKAQADTLDPDAVLVMEEVSLEEVQVARRNRLIDEQEAASGKTSQQIQDQRSKQPECKTRIHWLRGSIALIRGIALSAGKCISFQWKDSQQLGCVASAWCLVELPQFVQTAVESIDSRVVSKCLTLPEKSLQLAALLLVSVVSSLRLTLNARNIAGEFLRRFHHMQQVLIESLAGGGEGPYDMIARWLHEPPLGLPNENEFRCLVSFMIGQCICPPLAATPSLDLETSLAAPGKSLVSMGTRTLPPVDPKARSGEKMQEPELGAPPVAECGVPPAALLDKIAEEVLKEDQRLEHGPKKEGPLFSTMLCHLLYALAVMVPAHPKDAAQSSTVRGAAFAQLIKVQQIAAHGVQPKALYDPADGDRAKLFLYVRATACVRSALQTIMASWFAADFGARFVISEEGGKDFMQYCCKHINQAYNHKTALTRVLGSPWERVMLSQGPTATIAELLVVVCSSDANLVEVSKLGGHGWSRPREHGAQRMLSVKFGGGAGQGQGQGPAAPLPSGGDDFFDNWDAQGASGPNQAPNMRVQQPSHAQNGMQSLHHQGQPQPGPPGQPGQPLQPQWQAQGNSGASASDFVGAGAAAMGSMGFNEALAGAALNQAMSQMQMTGATRWFPYLFASLQQLFNVGHSYVLRKLVVLMCPFLKMKQEGNASWESPGDISECRRSVGPDGLKVDVDQPDLYIPVMSYVTYVLIYGLLASRMLPPNCHVLRPTLPRAEHRLAAPPQARALTRRTPCAAATVLLARRRREVQVRMPGFVSAGEDFDGVEVRDTVDGRGKCLVTLRPVVPGAEIIAEEPLFVRPAGWSLKRVAMKLRRLPAGLRLSMLELAQASGEASDDGGGALLRVLRANGVQSLGGDTSVCRLISRANHSCQPNATLCPEASGIRLIALKQLQPGDEVLVSYLSSEDLLRPISVRQRELERGPWGFRCACARCAGADLVRGMRCSCGGCFFPADGTWTRCSRCDAAPEPEALEQAERFWHAELSQLDRAVGSYDAIAARLHAAFHSPGPDPRPCRGKHWVAAWAARARAQAASEPLKAAAAARQLAAFVQHARDGLSPAHAEALALRAGAVATAAAAAGDSGRGRRGRQLARALAQRALAEAAPLLGAGHDVVRRLKEILEARQRGILHDFRPEVLPSTASFAMVLLFLEVGLIKMAFYVVGSAVPFLDLMANCSYKYVPVTMMVIARILTFQNPIYWLFFAYFAACAVLSSVCRKIRSPSGRSDLNVVSTRRCQSPDLRPPFMPAWAVRRFLLHFEPGTNGQYSVAPSAMHGHVITGLAIAQLALCWLLTPSATAAAAAPR
ncbi:unnamed protein product [Effrenium voratum]|nr:unnamed protein product [Effrenium voratum]